MLIGAPGRAVRMSGNLKEGKESVLDRQDPYFRSNSSWLCSDQFSKLVNTSRENDSASSTNWDQEFSASKYIHKNLLDNRSKSEHYRTPMNRPNTAVRLHVKKISEDFTITPTKCKDALKSDGILVQMQSSVLKDSEGRVPTGLSTLFSPKIHIKKSTKSAPQCSKCGPAKPQVAPMISNPPVASPPRKLGKMSLLSVSNSASSSKLHSRSPQRQNEFPLSPLPSPSFSRQRKLHAERPVISRPARRRKSQSAHTGFPNGILKVPFEQVKKAKLFAEKAVREGKVFAIHGAFPAIREALVKRGWVEKVLHIIPYVNPHPQNCVCTFVGWHLSSPPHNHSHPSSHSSSSSESSCSSSGSNSQGLNNSSKSVEGGNHISKDPLSIQHDPAVIPNELSVTSESLDKENQCFKPSYTDSPSTDGSDQKDTLLDDGSPIMRIDNYMNTFSEKHQPDEEETLIKHKDPEPEMDALNYKTQNNLNGNDMSSEYLVKLTKTLNTAFLGPSEIREGIHKSINEKNLSIFQYTVPPYERRRTTGSNSRRRKPPDLTTPQSPLNSSDSSYAFEIDRPFPEDNASTPNKDEPGIKDQNKENEEGGERSGRKNELKEVNSKPYNPFPELDYVLTSLDKPVVARVLRNVEPTFIWSWNRDSISFKHLSKEQLVNRFPNTPFTTKFGLCETLQQLHWFSEAASVDTFVPRGYCIGHEDERIAFIHDYRTTACLDILKWVTEGSADKGLQGVAHPMGEVPIRRVRQALQHVERYIQSCCHDDLDTPPLSPLRENEWDLILAAHHRTIHLGKRIKALPHHAETLLKDCQSALERVEPFWPQLQMDGVRNVWIVKPGAQSRGRGIFLLNHLEDILALVQSPLIYQTKYVVQKYMERPLLIYKTKFDIRQWFMVTDWNPLTVWMYKESYLRFCSQQFDLTNSDEAVHLSNNAIQCKYMNGDRDEALPEENMWDCHKFKEFLRAQGSGDAYEEVIYPGMKDALVSTMLAAQVQMDSFKHGFEFFGADFMLTEDLRPWLIEINSSPCMASTTSVTKRMCYECLNDTIKVVVDYRQNKSADTGNFELIYHDKEKSVATLPYHGVSLQVTGRQIWKPTGKQDKRRIKKIRPLTKIVKSLPLITLQLEDSGEIGPAKSCNLLDCQNMAQIGPTLTTLVTTAPSMGNLCASSDKTPADSDMGERQSSV